MFVHASRERLTWDQLAGRCIARILVTPACVGFVVYAVDSFVWEYYASFDGKPPVRVERIAIAGSNAADVLAW